MSNSHSRRAFCPPSWLIAVALFCATLLLYAPALKFDYVDYDDHGYVDQPQVRRGLTWAGVRWAFATGQGANWHPLTWLSHMADAELFSRGPEVGAGGAHLINALLHALNALLAFVALRRLTLQTWPSAIVAALFAFHPLRAESVAWISERKDLLSALFFLLSVIVYERYARAGSSGRGAAAYAALIVAFALGLLAKPMLVTLPFVLLLLDRWPLKRPARWALVLEKIPLFMLAVASCVITYRVQHASGAVLDDVYPLPLRLANAAAAYGQYLWKTLWPARLAAFYPYLGALPATSIPASSIVFGLAALALITLAAVLVWPRKRAPLVGWLWFCGMLVPVIGVVQVGMQSMADRYSYLPHLGLFIAIVFGLAALAERVRLPIAVSAVIVPVILLGLCLRTRVQVATWQNTVTLFTHALRVTTHNHVAHSNLAFAFMAEGRTSEAVEHLNTAIAINPRAREPYYNMGVLVDRAGGHHAAQEWFEKAIERDPGYFEAHLNLANVLLAQNQLDQAIVEYKVAIRLLPESFLAHYHLGLALQQKGDHASAIEEFAKAMELDPKHAEARYSHALSLESASRAAEAAREFARALELAKEQGLNDLAAAIERQQSAGGALPAPATKAQNR